MPQMAAIATRAITIIVDFFIFLLFYVFI